MGFTDLILIIITVLYCVGVWLWRGFSRRRAQPPVYRVHIIEPDKHYPLIERK